MLSESTHSICHKKALRKKKKKKRKKKKKLSSQMAEKNGQLPSRSC